MQPHVRPIPRGKTNAMTEFGAKVEISIIDGFPRIETLKFDAYNEGGNLQEIIEKYKKRNAFTFSECWWTRFTATKLTLSTAKRAKSQSPVSL